MIDSSKKEALVRKFNGLAAARAGWIRKNLYYYRKQAEFLRFLISQESAVLELGCGTGELLNILEPSRGVGVDFSPDMIRIARERYGHLEFREGDIEQLDFWGEQFDFIILADVIGHLQDVEEVFRSLKRFCKPTTRIIIGYHNFLWEPLLKWSEKVGLKMPEDHQNWLQLQDIGHLLALSGFEVVKKESRLLLPKKIYGLSTFVNRWIAPLPGFNRLCLCLYVVARPLHLHAKGLFSTSILIPCKNEKGNIRRIIERIPEFGGPQEILFVEGGSTDDTRAEIEQVIRDFSEKDLKLLIQDGKGKGDAVRKGFAAAKGDILMILDCDMTVRPEDLPKFYRAIAEDHGEFINGCRLIYPMEKQAMRFLNMIGNKFFSALFSWLLNQRLRDTLCGTKVLLKIHYDQIVNNRNYFGAFDPFGDFDLIFGAAKLNLKIIEIPIRYRARNYGQTQIKRFSHGWLLIKMCLFAMKKLKFNL